MSDIDALAVAVSGALSEMTTAVIAVREAVEGQARIYVELEDIREGMAELDQHVARLLRSEYQREMREQGSEPRVHLSEVTDPHSRRDHIGRVTEDEE